MIKNILFDMGGVLIRFEPQMFVDRLPLSAEERELLKRELYQSTEWVMCDRGTYSEEEIVRIVSERVPEHLRPYLDELALNWDREKLQIPGMEDLVRELSETGYELYLLTNAGIRHRQYWRTYPVSVYFPEERVYRSADHKVIKPETAFYEQALSVFGLKKEECLFIDDNPGNAESALRYGIPAVVFHQDARELRLKLRKLGIDVK